MTAENTREEQIQIANTIISQLGGRKFKMMTGARDIFALESGLSFKIPGTMTKNHINYITVVLDPNDTYNVKFFKVRMDTGMTLISEFSMIYDDGLQQLFTSETGLDTHF